MRVMRCVWTSVLVVLVLVVLVDGGSGSTLAEPYA